MKSPTSAAVPALSLVLSGALSSPSVATAGAEAPAGGTLLVSSDVACTVRVDGERVGDLAPDVPRKVEVSLGQHLG